MTKTIKQITNIFLWLKAFAMPFLACGIIVLIYPGIIGNEFFTYIILSIGVIAGIFFAEFVRKKYGFNVFFSKIFGSADIDHKVRLWK